MKKFFKEFKAFISRGNVMDMAVGVIIGGAFSAIVTALTNHILMPVINWVIAAIVGKDGMAGAVTFLSKVYTLDEAGQVVVDANGAQVIDMASSIYINWGAFITAIINFILIALVLFMIIKSFNNIKSANNSRYCGYTKEEYFELRKQGKSQKDVEALAKERDEKAAEEAAKKAEEEAAKAALPTRTEALLADILEELKKD
ncbi:MAG TPA: large conductance mechanosensitive channel protein MscL [Clostridiales bacterium]|nr:large conductance mechanosensitive channel protein MscL [Clostridiales bacterium]